MHLMQVNGPSVDSSSVVPPMRVGECFPPPPPWSICRTDGLKSPSGVERETSLAS